MFRIKRLGIRLTLVLSCILFVSVGLLGYFLAVNQMTDILNEITLGTHRLAETVKRSISHAMLNRDQETIIKSIDAIGRQKGIEKIRIFSKEGKVICSSDKAEVGNIVDKQAEACYQCHTAEKPLVSLKQQERSRVFYTEPGYRVLAVLDVIYNEEACWSASCHAHPREQNVLGVLDIAVSLEETDRRLAISTRTTTIIAAVLILGICGLAGFFIHRFVTKPTKRLLEGTRRLATGDLDHPIAVTSSDEIGELTKAFNHMTENLKRHIQKLTETQEQLFHSEKLASLGKMAAGIAHELNSPLAVILNDSSLLLRDLPDGSEEKENVKVIIAETKRCGEIIRDLLEFSRMDKPEKRLANVNEVMQETLLLAKHQALLHNIDVTLNLAAEVPNVMIDINQIKQVFLDIIINAVHAMPGGGSLIIKSGVSPDGTAVRIDFTDTGCGIPEENISKIFQPFFTTKDAKRGTGLGLAICYEIIQKHNGKIEVKSIVGEGTTFTVDLPAVTTAG